MLYRPLGRTGLSVSALGYGASPLGDEFGPADPEEAAHAVSLAIDEGVNYFDVAPYYGRGLAEERLGQALAGHRHEVFLATKVGRYDRALPDGFDFGAARIVRSVDESLRRLRTDYLDVVQAHDIEVAGRRQIIGECLPALRRLQESGKVRYVGITGYPVCLLRQVAESFPVDTVLSYCRYDLLDSSLDRVLAPAARSLGFGLISASPLHMRLLTSRGAPEWHPAPTRVRRASGEAAALCASRGVDIADLALQFSLGHPGIATTLVGMSKARHVAANIASVGVSPDPELLACVRAMLAPVADCVWRSGLPENDDPGAEASDP